MKRYKVILRPPGADAREPWEVWHVDDASVCTDHVVSGETFEQVMRRAAAKLDETIALPAMEFVI